MGVQWYRFPCFLTAEKTVVEDIKGKKDLTLKRNRVIFNKDIPDTIFTLKNQPFFEVIDLDD